MNLLIIGSKKSIESQLIKKEAILKKHQVKIISLTKILKHKPNLLKFDSFIFRAINKHIPQAKKIAKYLKKNNKIIIDKLLTKKNYYFDKLKIYQKLNKKNIPQPKTYYPFNQKNLKNLKMPVIVKHVQGMRGKNIFRFNSKKEILKFFENKKNIKNYLIQEFLASKYYFRVIVIGDKTIGAIQRLSLFCDNRPKISLEKRSKKANLSLALKNLSLKTAKAFGADFAGLDIMPDKNGKLYILEINRSPQFKRFTQKTKVNIAKKLIKYIENKYSKS